MKLKLLISGLAAMAITSVATAGPLVPNKTVDIIFSSADGSFDYCDGMHLVVNESTQRISGKHTGCINSVFTGVVGSFSKIGGGAAITTLYDGIATFIFVIDNDPKTWEIYSYDGSFVNSGTYKIGVAGVADGGPRTIDK